MPINKGLTSKRTRDGIRQRVSRRPERVIFSIGHNQNSFPNTQVIQAIEKALPSIQMYTTGSSDVLINHIGEDVESPHKDCVGTICLVINENPLDFSFSNS